jgi:tRNA-intron endonuclease
VITLPKKSDISDQNDKTKQNSKSITSYLEEDQVVVKDHQDARIIYDNGYYGLLLKDKTLSLNFDEALHLLERGVITISDKNEQLLDVDDCTRIFSQKKESFWKDYLVFKDLRNRGYIVGRGISDSVKYRLYPRGATIGKDIAKIMICPIAEGGPISVEDLDEMVTQTRSLRKKLLIACVDRLGDVSYYELQTLFNQEK